VAGRQSRQNAEDASGACYPGGVGMEVGKGQQAQARKDHKGFRCIGDRVTVKRFDCLGLFAVVAVPVV
jgi:hypothetical protein